MAERRKRIGDLLLERGLITKDQLSQALATQRESHERLGRILVQRGAVTEHDLLHALADLYQTQVWDLAAAPPQEEALEAIPVASCARFTVVPVALDGDALTLAMANVDDLEAVDHVAHESGRQVRPVIASERHILAKIEELRDISGDAAKISSQAIEIVAGSVHEDDNNEVLTDEDAKAVASLLNQILLEGLKQKSSDLHIEPGRGMVEVRTRVDGMMQRARSYPCNLHPAVVARVKSLAGMDLKVRRAPQEGRFNVRAAGKGVDVMASVLPTRYGERIALRLVECSAAILDVKALGLTPANVELFNELVHRPYGLVFVTGPDGSGKTATLYAALNALKGPGVNIMTCEDPIKLDIEGVAQSQVNESAGETYAALLRAILRQDPDVVLIGEVRDKDTAETAMRAAMGGKLVLSTLRCNDAISALPYLYDMGVRPNLLSTALVGVVSQRLVRRLCPDCKVEEEPKESDLALFRAAAGPRGVLHKVFRASGCPKCSGVGYRGRFGVYEIIPVNLELAAMIANGASLDSMVATAQGLGFRSMQADVILRVAEGVTSFDEARRVVAFDAGASKRQRQAA